MDELATFRSSKRRKTRRHIHNESDDDEDQTQAGLRPNEDVVARVASDPTVDNEDNIIDLQSLLRARKQNKIRGGGVQFSNAKIERSNEDAESKSLTKKIQPSEKLMEISNRFVGVSGQVVDVDQHMMAYIDKELARKRIASPAILDPQQKEGDLSISSADINQNVQMTENKTSSNDIHHPFHGSLIQLREVDLGPSIHTINQARTQAAIARAQSGQQISLDEIKPPKLRKPRITRDGRLIKPRPRKSRPTEDIARDSLVEQVLHEHSLDMYDTSNPQSTQQNKPTITIKNSIKADDHLRTSPSLVDRQNAGQTSIEPEIDTDEVLARQFRQEFFDAIADRHHHNNNTNTNRNNKTGPNSTSATQNKSQGVDRGPKLGGSRSARAKMVQAQKEAQSQK